MKPHSVWLSVVERAKLADHCMLNQTAQAAPDIVKQLVLVALHISSIFISPFFMSLRSVCWLCV